MSRRLTVLSLIVFVASSAAPAHAAGLEDIHGHTSQGRTVFLVLTDAAAKGLDGARKVAATAQQRVPGSAVVVLNRSEPAQRPAVAKYRVAGAPVPLVLVIARSGLAVGAARPHANGAVDRLVGLVPTPAKSDYLRILHERQVAMVVFSRRTMKEQSPLFEQISAVNRTPNRKVRSVLVDLDDPKERAWIAQWKLDPAKVTRPLLIFVNPQGRIIARLEGAPTADEMLKTSRKKVKGCGCGNPNCRGHK